MNRIGWFVVCLVTASAVQSSLGNGTPAENPRDFNSITKLTSVPEILDRDVVQVRNFFDDLLGDEMETEGLARTFGHRRVAMMMLAPLMYKMGVMTTMLAVLTVISLKGLVIGLILLMLKLSSFFAKFHMGWQHQGYSHGWPPPPQPQPVHVHIQGGDGPHSHGHPYGAWPSASGPPVDEEQHYYYKG